MAREFKNMLVNGLHDRAFKEMAARFLHGRVIDIGCGTKPYERLLSPMVEEHVGVDLPDGIHGSHRVDIAADAYSIPVPDESFDGAICTAVLEHLEEPARALGECFRVLRPGAVAIYSAPFIWHLHEEPRDFFRYSKYGLTYLAEQAGFEVVEMKPLSGFWVTFGQLLVYSLYRAHRGRLRRLPLIPAVGLAIQVVALGLNRIDRAEQWPWMYMAAFRKPKHP
jgi:ubiquinone/menaquinone biosynthesis C-methylase UbiE